MAAVPYWDDTEDENAPLWDYMWLGSTLIPGVIQSFDVNNTNDVAVGQAQGNTGASTTHKGRKPRDINVKIKVTNKQQWEAWDDALRDLNLYAADSATRPFTITHPNAQKFGIESVWVITFSSPLPNNKDGWIITMKLLENIPPKPTNPKPKSQKAQDASPPQDFGSTGFLPPSNELG